MAATNTAENWCISLCYIQLGEGRTSPACSDTEHHLDELFG